MGSSESRARHLASINFLQLCIDFISPQFIPKGNCSNAGDELVEKVLVAKFNIPFNVATARFPPPTLNPDQPPRGRRIDYKMAR